MILFDNYYEIISKNNSKNVCVIFISNATDYEHTLA